MGQNKTFQQRENAAIRNKWPGNFTANLVLLVSGFAMSVSGLIIQGHYHLAGSPDKSTVLLLDRTAWNSIHAWVSVCFLFIVIYHVRVHVKWYKGVFKQGTSPKSRPTLILTGLMAVTAVSGIIPLLISFFDGGSSFRFTLVEIHDKMAVVFLIAVFLHTRRRWKRYGNAIRNKF